MQVIKSYTVSVSSVFFVLDQYSLPFAVNAVLEVPNFLLEFRGSS